MKKLGAVDANFLYIETEKTPNHVASVQLFELPEHNTAEQFVAGLKKFYMKRIHLVPYLTNVARFTPGNIDHPVWVKDVNFSIDNHIFHVELSAPGSFAQLEQKVAEIHAELIDRNKPLWQLFVISGLQGNRIAYYSQAHHACLDGMAGQAATMILMDTIPDRVVEPATAEYGEADRGLFELFNLSLQNMLNYQLDTPNRFLGTMDSMGRMARRALDPARSFGAAVRSAPKTRFNRMVGKERTFSAGEMSIKDMKAMGKAADCKLNDIFLAACSGGLRRYLARNGELPGKSLTAGCPVSVREAGDTSMGNKVTMMAVALATDIRDPLLRLQAIIDSSRTGKQVVDDMSPAFNPEVSVYGLPALVSAATRFGELLGLANIAPAAMNLVISNVPGPRNTLYSNGAKMLTHYPVSIPTHGVGLNITASSYVDNLYFSITACAMALPDATELRNDIMTAYNELMSALLPETHRVADFRARPKATVADDATETQNPLYKEAS